MKRITHHLVGGLQRRPQAVLRLLAPVEQLRQIWTHKYKQIPDEKKILGSDLLEILTCEHAYDLLPAGAEVGQQVGGGGEEHVIHVPWGGE